MWDPSVLSHDHVVALDQRVREELVAHPPHLGASLGRIVGLHLEVDASDAAEARAKVEQMCEQLLANPLIESYEITVSQQ